MSDEIILQKLKLLEDYLDDVKEKVSEHVNISEHSGDMRKLINEIRKIVSQKEANQNES